VHNAEDSIFIAVDLVLLNEIPYRDHIDRVRRRERVLNMLPYIHTAF
jgi:predicted RNA-binding protein with PUA domain